jgi:general stress protein 26
VARWTVFVERGGSLAEIAEDRLIDRVAYLGTAREDGSPRVHPVTPKVHDGRLFVRMYPTSPKVSDLRRDPRFALHSQVEDTSGSGGEVLISGKAGMVHDRAWIEKAFVGISDPDPSRYVVFELDIQDVKVTVYEGENTVRRRWRAGN